MAAASTCSGDADVLSETVMSNMWPIVPTYESSAIAGWLICFTLVTRATEAAGSDTSTQKL